MMIKEGINGFCMALADSVPGVSGGTVAYIMGFYNQFIGAIHNVVFGNRKEKKEALTYLVKLGIGWILGMGIAVIALSSLFESHIYTVSSLFFGFIIGAIPLIVLEEREDFKKVKEGILWGMIGILFVVLLTWLNGRMGSNTMDLGKFTLGLGIRLFLIGMFAISAMFLPGISGSTMLLIFGAYMPVIAAVKGVLAFDLSYFPCLIFFGCGILTGAVTVVKAIKVCMEKFHAQTVYTIVGMMVGSLYAIVMGPTTLKIQQPPLSFREFRMIPALLGVALVLGMQMIKEKRANKMQ